MSSKGTPIRSIRVSDAQWERFRAAATAAGTDVATWLRAAGEHYLASPTHTQVTAMVEVDRHASGRAPATGHQMPRLVQRIYEGDGSTPERSIILHDTQTSAGRVNTDYWDRKLGGKARKGAPAQP